MPLCRDFVQLDAYKEIKLVKQEMSSSGKTQAHLASYFTWKTAVEKYLAKYICTQLKRGGTNKNVTVHYSMLNNDKHIVKAL